MQTFMSKLERRSVYGRPAGYKGFFERFVRVGSLHEPHRRALRRLANRFGIGHVVLLSFHEWFHVGRWNEPRVVTYRGDLACPVMSARTVLHCHHASWRGREV